MSQESDQPIHPEVLRAMRAQAYPEILDNNGIPWYINDLREKGTEIARLTAERDALLAERERLRFCVGFFASVIKCGEPWTETCEKAREGALNAK